MKFIQVSREQMERCGRALPKRVYRCKASGTIYLNDDAYKHVLFDCPKNHGSTSLRKS